MELRTFLFNSGTDLIGVLGVPTGRGSDDRDRGRNLTDADESPDITRAALRPTGPAGALVSHQAARPPHPATEADRPCSISSPRAEGDPCRWS